MAGRAVLRIEMRSAERAAKLAVFLCHNARCSLSHAQRGGCDMLKSRNAAEPLSFISLIPLWLSPLNRPDTLTTREIEKDESDPPPTGGDLRPFVETCCDMSLLRPHGGRSRPHLSLREGSEQDPFPLALHRVGSVLAVKGSLRRFAPWTAPGRSERRAAYEGKGGLWVRAVWTGRKEPFGHTGRLEPQPRGGVTRRAVAQRRSRAAA